MKNYICIENKDEWSVLLDYLKNSGYHAPGGADLETLSLVVGNDNYPVIVYEDKKDKEIGLRYLSVGCIKDDCTENDNLEACLKSLDNEKDALFYSNLTYYLDYNAPILDTAFPGWTWDLNEEDPVAIINGKRYMSEMTLSAAWPDHLCRRVKIDGVYYYCS